MKYFFDYRFGEYILSCPSTEVRTAFLKILVHLADYSLHDGPCVPPSLNAPSKNKYSPLNKNIVTF